MEPLQGCRRLIVQRTCDYLQHLATPTFTCFHVLHFSWDVLQRLASMTPEEPLDRPGLSELPRDPHSFLKTSVWGLALGSLTIKKIWSFAKIGTSNFAWPWTLSRFWNDRRLGGAASTGKSFRFVRACARCPLPNENEPQTWCSPFSFFPSRWGGLHFSLCAGEASPFPLRSPPLPPNSYPTLVCLIGILANLWFSKHGDELIDYVVNLLFLTLTLKCRFLNLCCDFDQWFAYIPIWLWIHPLLIDH